MKKFSNLKISQIRNKLTHKEFIETIQIIKQENTHALVSGLSKDLLKKYLKIAIRSKNIFLYILKKRNYVIGYALFAKKEDYLIKDFQTLKFTILLHLVLNFKIITLVNIFMAITKIDLIFLNKNKNVDLNCLNLNLLGINKEFQSNGFGKYFLNKALTDIQKNGFKFKCVTCEAPTIGSVNFYLKKNNFKYIGKKLRLTNNLTILKKNINSKKS